MNKTFHKGDLVDAHREKELRELSERFFTQGAASVELGKVECQVGEGPSAAEFSPIKRGSMRDTNSPLSAAPMSASVAT